VRLQQGRFLFNQERFRDATDVFAALSSRGSEEVRGEATYWLARSWQQLDDGGRAERALMTLLTDFPGSQFSNEARIRLGQMRFDREAYSEAIQVLEPLSRSSLPERAEALYLLARCHLELGDPTRAEVELRRLIDDYPGSPVAAQGRLRMAELALTRGNYNIAGTQLNTILAERTDELAAEAQYLAGEVLFAQERWAEAEVQYHRIKYVYPAFTDWIARATWRAGVVNVRLEEYGKARELFQTVLDEYPDTSAAALARASIERLPPIERVPR
jgi:TolA-binding protein